MTLFDVAVGLPLCLALGVAFWWAGERFYAWRDLR